MSRPIIKFIADFGPLLIFFTIYFNNNNDLKLAIPPFIIATLIALVVVYFLEKRIPMVPLTSGILITLFGGLTLYFNNKIFFYMKPTIINLLFAGVLFFGKYVTKKPLLKIFFQNAFNLKDEGWKRLNYHWIFFLFLSQYLMRLCGELSLKLFGLILKSGVCCQLLFYLLQVKFH